eukprot:1189328-Prorocentrum_minimum.AAC.3
MPPPTTPPKYSHTQPYQVVGNLEIDEGTVIPFEGDAERPCVGCLLRYRWTLVCISVLVLIFGIIEILIHELVNDSHDNSDAGPSFNYEVPEYGRIAYNSSKLSGFVTLGEDGYLYTPSGEQFRLAGCNIYWLGRDENVPGETYPSAFR